ncbi:MAG TPA: hypothetical protein VI299_12340, partial [Polyangiales bacterium]
MVNEGSVPLQERNLSSWLARLIDASLIFLAQYVATFSREYLSVFDPKLAISTLVAIAVFTVIADANGLYRTALRSSPAKVELGKVWLSWGLTPPILLTVAFATKTGDDYSRV